MLINITIIFGEKVMMQKNEELITWTNKLACGVKIIDKQHQGLVNLVNDMFMHATGNGIQERDYFERVIKEVVSYVKIHFETEERILQATKFAGYIEHKKEHDSFIMAVIENIQDYKSGKRLTLSSFTKYLKDWILSHIAFKDKIYFDHFKKIATRSDNGKLSIKIKEKQGI